MPFVLGDIAEGVVGFPGGINVSGAVMCTQPAFTVIHVHSQCKAAFAAAYIPTAVSGALRYRYPHVRRVTVWCVTAATFVNDRATCSKEQKCAQDTCANDHDDTYRRRWYVGVIMFKGCYNSITCTRDHKRGCPPPLLVSSTILCFSSDRHAAVSPMNCLTASLWILAQSWSGNSIFLPKCVVT